MAQSAPMCDTPGKRREENHTPAFTIHLQEHMLVRSHENSSARFKPPTTIRPSMRKLAYARIFSSKAYFPRALERTKMHFHARAKRNVDYVRAVQHCSGLVLPVSAIFGVVRPLLARCSTLCQLVVRPVSAMFGTTVGAMFRMCSVFSASVGHFWDGTTNLGALVQHQSCFRPFSGSYDHSWRKVHHVSH